MRIEIDTKHDSKEELAHLADMLRAIAGSQSAVSASDARLQRRLARQGAVRSDVFGSSVASDPQAGPAGIFGLFDDGPSSSAQQAVSSSPEPQPSGDIFSLFNSSPGEQPQAAQPVQPQFSSSALLQDSSDDWPEDRKSGGKDILDDDRIIPY